ncbi:site-specific DNA-methyltransferase [Ligilactobacillus agilis]|uniref:site-specific DNA-methyltransferase n=1 Tax=Ligilactobacillus agilis TaxID=1601 RepID=UPI001958A279|nr:site-specific DNA-methyltransferase [Ligilactobacillus agilis]MBM6762375.1 site-specific DNA-methyltransferase [Ligilactobacillus agilis]
MISDNEKFNMQVKPNSAFLAELKNKLPEFFDSEGNFDLDKFKGQLKEHNINELSDGYQLNFIGKDYARRQAGEVPSTVIVPDEEQNNGEGKDSKNLFFTGDNLEVLRHLQNNYANKIDVIYIDPPYNTGDDSFVYPDAFEYTDDKLRDMFGLDDSQLNRLKSIQGKSSHSAWLSFIYPRLILGGKLLSDNGVIFISIDDNESRNLELLMVDIFGEDYYVGKFVWTRKKKGSFLNKQLRKMTEYVIYFDRNRTRENFGEKAYSDKKQPIVKRTNSLSNLYFPEGVIHTTLDNGEYIPPEAVSDTAINFRDKVIVKDGIVVNSLKTEAHYIWSQDFLNNEINNGSEIWLSKKFGINILRAGQENRFKAPSSIINSKVNVGTNEDATEYLEKMFGKINMFSYAKPVSLIKYLINMVTWDKKNALILDFFAGSSTTADAVMQLNAEDGGNRKFIMVQLPEKTYTVNSDGKEVPTKGGKTAYEAGFKSIDEISRERIRRAAAKIKTDNDLTLPKDFDGSFKHYRVVDPTKQTLEDIEDFDPDNTTLFTDMVDSFSSKGLDVAGDATGEQTILTTWLAKDGYSFDANIKKIDFDGYEASLVEDSRLYIINNGWSSVNTKSLLNKIGTHQIIVQTIVLFGYSFNIADLRELEIGLKQLEGNINLLKRY